ncbi:MAG: CBS domain-containing protein [Catalinimonas sp.]
MTAENLINPLIPALKSTDPVRRALAWMEEFSLRQLPVIDQRHFVGMATDTDLVDTNDPEALLGTLVLGGQYAHVQYRQHFYEVLRLAIDHGTHAVAVLDEDGFYAGLITVKDTITAFARSYAVQTRGGILVMALDERDYSLSEISRLVESNNAKILSAFVGEEEVYPRRLRLTLKINQTDLSHVAATFERFGYQITAQFSEAEVQETEKERLDILLRYLDI